MMAVARAAAMVVYWGAYLVVLKARMMVGRMAVKMVV
jgi:hypothetical protein